MPIKLNKEKDVLKLLEKGYTNKEIAETLGCTVSYVYKTLHPEKYKARQQKYFNTSKAKAKAKEWRLQHRDECLTNNKAYYKSHKNERIKKTKKWQEEHKYDLIVYKKAFEELANTLVTVKFDAKRRLSKEKYARLSQEVQDRYIKRARKIILQSK